MLSFVALGSTRRGWREPFVAVWPFSPAMEASFGLHASYWASWHQVVKFCSQKNWHFFPCKQNFKPWSESNGTLFWGNDPKFILATKNIFLRYIICLFLVLFAKSRTFWDKLWNFLVKVCFVLRAEPTRTQNQNLRPLPDSFQCCESNGSLRIRKWDSVENCVFWDKHHCLVLHEISISWNLRLYFGHHTLGLMLMSRVQF